MKLTVFLVGIGLMAIGLVGLYYILKYIITPYNRFVFENSNAHGVVELADWDAAVRFRKYQAKKEFLEALVGWPTAILFFGGFLMAVFTVVYHFSM